MLTRPKMTARAARLPIRLFSPRSMLRTTGILVSMVAMRTSSPMFKSRLKNMVLDMVGLLMDGFMDKWSDTGLQFQYTKYLQNRES